MLGSAGCSALRRADVDRVLRQAIVLTSVRLAGTLSRVLRSAAASRVL
jgi:hypothetical protein